MLQWYRQRYLDLLGSIYIRNEHRGYTAVDRMLAAIQLRWLDEHLLPLVGCELEALAA